MEKTARVPKVRSDCEAGGFNELRPCPYTVCRYHLANDLVKGSKGRGKGVMVLGQWYEDGLDTCALDVANRGGGTLEEIAQAMCMTREAVRMIEANALIKLRRTTDRADFDEHLEDI